MFFLPETEERKITNVRKPLFFHNDPANQHEKKDRKNVRKPLFSDRKWKKTALNMSGNP